MNMRVITLNLRSSLSRFAVVPLVLIGLAILFGRNQFWMGIWPETGAALTVASFFMSLLCAGLSAWTASRADMNGVREQALASAISSRRLELARFGTELCWMLIAYILVASIAFVSTAIVHFGPGIPMFLSYMLLGMLWISLAVSVGWFLGRLLDPLMAGLVAALVWFIFSSTIGSAAQATPLSGPPWFEVSTATLIARTAAVAVLVSALCLIPSRTLKPSYRRQVGLATGALVLVVLSLMSTTVQTQRAPVASPPCYQGTIEYCLWPEHDVYFALVEEVDSQVAALPLDLALPKRIVDYQLVTGEEVVGSNDVPPQVDISEGSRWALARGVASAITGELLQDCDPLAPVDPNLGWDQIQSWLEWRLAGGGTPDYTTDAPGELQAAWAEGQEAATTLSDTEQATWAASLIDNSLTNYCLAI